MGDIKILLFSPFEDFNITGVDTRKQAPCMLYNLATREELNKAQEKLQKTKWYDNLLKEDYKKEILAPGPYLYLLLLSFSFLAAVISFIFSIGSGRCL